MGGGSAPGPSQLVQGFLSKCTSCPRRWSMDVSTSSLCSQALRAERELPGASVQGSPPTPGAALTQTWQWARRAFGPAPALRRPRADCPVRAEP